MPTLTVQTTTSLTSIIGNVVAPVGLISTTAILLSGYTGKYSSMSDQMRRLTGEYRAVACSSVRRESLKRQLDLYHRRITAMWGASALLSIALLAFVATVLVVMLSSHTSKIGILGLIPMLVGLALVASAVGLELYEIGLARLTSAGELADIFSEKELPDDP
ncbi:MAG: DUF2721 domain-containing protein [Janthinobacterium lividum]